MDGRGYTEHFAELIWKLNPWAPNYGWVFTRSQGWEEHNLFKVGDDNEWHYFEEEVWYETWHNQYILHRIKFDNKEVVLDMLMGTMQHDWGYTVPVIFRLLFDTGNMYPNCLPEHMDRVTTTVGTSRWDGLKVEYAPLNK